MNLAKNHCLWMTVLNGQIIGMIGLVHTARHAVKIGWFWIDPEWQHTSVAKGLIERVRQYCWNRACFKLMAEVSSVPRWLATLFGRNGFRLAQQATGGGKGMYEFYLDLCRQPPDAQAGPPALPVAATSTASTVGTALKTEGQAPAAPQRIVRVLLADDHSLVRKGMADLLREWLDVDVVGEACDGLEAVQMALQIKPDVVLMDVTMPGMDGIEATRRITSQLPQVRVIGLSMHEGQEMASAMRRAGAAGYLCKGDPAEEILAAVLQHA
jgi:CheY-like chemotaxis protein/GNAT superfamily N-acetyltransferase